MRGTRTICLLGAALLSLLATASAEAAVSVIAGSVVNATVTDADKATDGDYMTNMEINASGVEGERVSFDLDLGADTVVDGVAIYGHYLYTDQVQMLSDEITVEAARDAAGPWTQIGSIDVGHTRPTDPDPAIGGVNPFTGGNGRRIPCTPTTARYLRIAGGQGFDNLIRIGHIQINPQIVLNTVTPIYQGVAYTPFDPGGGDDNARIGVDMVDGKINTRTFLGSVTTVALDLGSAQSVQEFRLLTSEDNGNHMVKTGTVRVSSTDDPTNFDVLETNFNTNQPRTSGAYAVGQIRLPNRPTKRYFQLRFETNRDGGVPDGSAVALRIGEIEYRRAGEAALTGAAVLAGSLVGGTTPGGSEGESSAMDANYTQTYFQIDQGAETSGTFVINLGASVPVHSVAFYGVYSFLASQMMFSGNVTVEAGNSASGPWTQIGVVDAGTTRPTAADPAIGGVNPWTGGNGRLIPCTPTTATHLRIGFGYGYDNLLRLYHAVVNAPFAIHELDPVEQGSTLPVFDFGNGDYNSRCAVDLADGNLQTWVNPQRPIAATLDLGQVTRIGKVRFYASESDLTLLPTQGVIRVSSTDNPAAIDTTVLSFNQTYTGGGVTEVVLPTPVEKRYIQIEQTETGRRWAEYEVVPAGAAPEAAPSAAAHWTLY